MDEKLNNSFIAVLKDFLNSLFDPTFSLCQNYK